MGCKPPSRFVDRLRVAVDRGYVRPQSKEGGAVSAAPQSAIEYCLRALEQFSDFIREHRRVIGTVPRARCSRHQRQKRLIWSSTAGVNCGMAVRSCFAASAYDCSPAGTFSCAVAKESFASRARVQLLESCASFTALCPTRNAEAPARNFASAEASSWSERMRN